MRIGILGAGGMGRTHAAAYTRIPGVEVAAIVGRREPKVKELAAKLGVPGLTDPWSVLEDDAIDAIDITYPTFIHREYVIAALERGKHVFCETPMALSVDDADAMIAAAQSRRRIFMVALLMRFVAEYVFIHDAVASGDLGQPLVAFANRLSAPYWSPERDPARFGEPAVELMIHDFDYLNWLFGVPVTVSGTGMVGPSGVVDYAFVLLQFGGPLAMVEGSAMMPKSFPFSTSARVLCEEGMLETSFRFEGDGIRKILRRFPSKGDAEPLEVPGEDPYEAECEYFVRCLRGEADPTFLGAEVARNALRVSLAARDSLASGKPVSLGLDRPDG